MAEPLIKISDLEKAHKGLVDTYNLYKGSINLLDNQNIETIRDSLIKKFEYNYEISRKILKQFLLKEKLITNKINRLTEILQIATENAYIENPTQWKRYNDLRNATSHEYSRKNTDNTILSMKEFIYDQSILLTNLQKRKN